MSEPIHTERQTFNPSIHVPRMPYSNGRQSTSNRSNIANQRYQANQENIADQKKQAFDDLVSQGYDPEKLLAYHNGGGDIRKLLQKPSTPDAQSLVQLANEAKIARLTKTLNPQAKTTPFTDPSTGQKYDIQKNSDGTRTMIPQTDEKGNALWQSKPGAFKGTDDQGNKWQMDRNDQGAADNYQITKAAKDPSIKQEIGPDGKISKYQEVRNDDGGITRKPLGDLTDEDGNTLYDTKVKQKWGSHENLGGEPIVIGQANQDKYGSWDESSAKYDLSPAAKNWARDAGNKASRLQSNIAWAQTQRSMILQDPGWKTNDAKKQQLSQLNDSMKKAQDVLDNVNARRTQFQSILDKHGVAGNMPKQDVANTEFDQGANPPGTNSKGSPVDSNGSMLPSSGSNSNASQDDSGENAPIEGVNNDQGGGKSNASSKTYNSMDEAQDDMNNGNLTPGTVFNVMHEGRLRQATVDE